MPESEAPKRPLQLDVQAAVKRGEEIADRAWVDANYTDLEAAFTDRRLLAQEVKWLWEELAHTQDTLKDADREIRYLNRMYEPLL